MPLFLTYLPCFTLFSLTVNCLFFKINLPVAKSWSIALFIFVLDSATFCFLSLSFIVSISPGCMAIALKIFSLIKIFLIFFSFPINPSLVISITQISMFYKSKFTFLLINFINIDFVKF